MTIIRRGIPNEHGAPSWLFCDDGTWLEFVRCHSRPEIYMAELADDERVVPDGKGAGWIYRRMKRERNETETP